MKLNFTLTRDQLQFHVTWKSLINNKNRPFGFCKSLKQHALVCLKYYFLLPPYFLKEDGSSVSTNSLGPRSPEFPATTAWSEAIEVSVKVLKLDSH